MWSEYESRERESHSRVFIMEGEPATTAMATSSAPVPASSTSGASNPVHARRSRRRWVSDATRRGLDAAFREDPTPSRDVLIELAEKCGASLKQVSVWFSARRAKEKAQRSEHEPADVRDDDAWAGGEGDDDVGDGNDSYYGDGGDHSEGEDGTNSVAKAEQSAASITDMRGGAPSMHAEDHRAGAHAPAVSSTHGGTRVLIPEACELLAIEHPCYVVNADRGVRMLGGTQAIARASASNSTSMECSLRPQDPLAHPLFGVRVDTPGVLLKVTRRKRKASTATAAGTDSPAALSPAPSAPTGPAHASFAASKPKMAIEVLGSVTSSYRFEGLADYQFVSDPSLLNTLEPGPHSANTPFDLIGTLEPLAAHAMRIPPSLFSMYDVPLEYLPRKGATGALGETESVSQKGSAARKRRGDALVVGNALQPRRQRAKTGKAKPMHFGQRVEFDAAAVPTGPPPKIAATIDLEDELFIAMKAKFAQRPVWSRQALKASLPEHLNITEERLKFRLPQLAFYFAQGPWRMCWIAFGYDPRASRDSRIYQVLDLRLPPEVEHLVPKKSGRRLVGAPARIMESAASHAGDACSSVGGDVASVTDGGRVRNIPGDQALPTQRHVYFQMCDFTGDALVQLVHEEESATAMQRCHKAHGWYTSDNMEKARLLLKQSMLQLARGAAGGKPLLMDDSRRRKQETNAASVPYSKTSPSSSSASPPAAAGATLSSGDARQPEDEDADEDDGPWDQQTRESPSHGARLPATMNGAEAVAFSASVVPSGGLADASSFGIFDDVHDMMDEGSDEESDAHASVQDGEVMDDVDDEDEESSVNETDEGSGTDSGHSKRYADDDDDEVDDDDDDDDDDGPLYGDDDDGALHFAE